MDIRQPRQARRAARGPRTAGAPDGTAALTALGGVRHRAPLTVALVGSRCWLADALARGLTEAGEHVVRLDLDAELDRELDAELDMRTVAGHGADGHGADVVVHLAGGPLEVSLRGRSEPALQTLAALHAARADGARLVIASLPGNTARLGADDALAEGFRTAHDVETVVVEVAECYGPGMPADRTGVLGRMLHQARTDGIVVVEADDETTHPVCFVDDAVAGLVAVVRGEAVGRFRVAPPTAVPTLDLARAVAEATGAVCRVRDRHRLRVAAPGGDVAPGLGDAAVGMSPPVGWAPQVDLAEGLARSLVGRSDVTVVTVATGLPATGAGLPLGAVDRRGQPTKMGDDVVA